MEPLQPLEIPDSWKAEEKLRLKASAYAGFSIEEPQDFSEMSVRQVSAETKQKYSGLMYWVLTTKLFTHHVVDGENCEIEITIVRKSQKRPKV